MKSFLCSGERIRLIGFRTCTGASVECLRKQNRRTEKKKRLILEISISGKRQFMCKHMKLKR